MTPHSSQRPPSDHLDEAIDHVARHLTRVEDDAMFASRVIASLPERTTWFGWLTHSWAPRLAMIAIIVVASLLWSRRHTTEVPTSAPLLASSVTVSAPSALVASVSREPLEPRRTKPTERLEPVEPLEPFVGLPSVEVPTALALNEVAPAALVEEGSMPVPLLVTSDLPLTAETFPQRD